MNGKLFLSHAHADKQAAQTLRRALEDSGVAVWEDVLGLRAGDGLSQLEAEVMGARGLLLLWTAAANESEWVERETAWARQAREANPDYRLLVVLRGGGKVSARRIVGEELVFIPVDGAVEDAVPEIRRALGELAPSGRAAEAPAPTPLLEELVISFTEARIEESGGRHRAAARFRIVHEPAQGTGSRSGWKDFESPLGPIELEEIRWYLERYPGWPFGTFRERAEKLETNLWVWGRELYDRTLGLGGEQTSAWRRASGHARRVVIEVDDQGEGTGAAALLALPWELLADEEGYLFEGGLKARVIRRIPRETSKEPLPTADRLRVLLVIARPEEEGVGFIDPRASARSLIEALAPLGHRAELEVLEDGTFPALREALEEAEKKGRPFHVVHFDGHGIYDKTVGLGMLCFEDPADAERNELQRRKELIDADTLGALLRERRVPLFVLEACQTAMADEKATSSVAAPLLRAGVGSVLAMTHAVLVETARRFVGRFYQELAAGERIGTAMVAAEHHLKNDPYRGEVGGFGELHLHDWFVPVLFQEEEGDLRLLQAGAMANPQDLAGQRKVREGDLPQPPAHGFVGRAYELLRVQRLLRDERSLTLLGEGGQGKTALAIECARWLLGLRRFERVAFATVEDLPGVRVLLDRLGRQLVPNYSVAMAEGTGTDEERLRRARLPVERVLAERRVLLVVDNLESILPAPDQPALPGLDVMLALLSDFAQIGGTRLLLTSREVPPSPLEVRAIRLGPLSKFEGREVVAGVLARAGQAPAGNAEVDCIDELIERVDGHARSLVLLAPLVAERGLKVTAESVAAILAELEARHPGKRELSLLASVRLSLDRLPEPARTQARALAVFHGAAHYQTLAHVIEIEENEALSLGRQLVALGLASAEGPYLFSDPALGPAVADELSEEEHGGMEERWLKASLSWIAFLYRTRFQDPKAATEGTQATLKDLLAVAMRAEEKIETEDLSAEGAVIAIVRLQQLFRFLGRPAILARLEEIRRRLEQRLGAWSHALFLCAQAEIEQRLDTGDVSGAVLAAEKLREQAAVGSDYPQAAYDNAMACGLLGRAMVAAGQAAAGLYVLDEAERRFSELALTERRHRAQMLSVVRSSRGDALRLLGLFEEAAECYESAIKIAESVGNRRTAAVNRGQLGTIRLLQGRLTDALDTYERARQTFGILQEPGSVATAWHQIGLVYEQAKQRDNAEEAYQKSLRIKIELGDKSAQASTLDQIGILYHGLERLEESAQLHQQAALLRRELGDSFNQARSLSNLALCLLKLGNLDDARGVAIEAAQLKSPFGHSAEPWTTWLILQDVESLANQPDGAAVARSRASELYGGYRRDGGAPQSSTARLIMAVGQALRSQGGLEARHLIPPPEWFGERLLPVRDALLAIVGGSCDPQLASDPRLDCEDAVELQMLVESISEDNQWYNDTSAGGLLHLQTIQMSEGWSGLEESLPETARRVASAGGNFPGYWLATVLSSELSAGAFLKGDHGLLDRCLLLPDDVREPAWQYARALLRESLFPKVFRSQGAREKRDESETAASALGSASVDWTQAVLSGHQCLTNGDVATAVKRLEYACTELQRLDLRKAQAAARFLHATALTYLGTNNVSTYWRQLAEDAHALDLRVLAARSLYELALSLPKGSSEYARALSRAEELADELGLVFFVLQIGALRDPLGKSKELQAGLSSFIERVARMSTEIVGSKDASLPPPEIVGVLLWPTLFPNGSAAERGAGAILFKELLWPRRVDEILRESEKLLLRLSTYSRQAASSHAVATAWSHLARAKALVNYESPLSRSEALLQAARFYRVSGEPHLARPNLLTARGLNPLFLTAASIYAELAVLEESEENLHLALRYLNDALRYTDRLGSARLRIRLLYHKGRLLMRMGHSSDGQKIFELLVSESEGNDDEAVLTARSLATKTLWELKGRTL